MPDNNEPIRIGRITRSTEKSLGISLTGSVLIYMEPEAIDKIAGKRPTDYLSYLQEIESILREPDFVAFDQEHERFLFIKGYIRSGAYSQVYVSVEHRGTPAQWTFAGIFTSPSFNLPKAVEGLNFTRVRDYKNVPKSKA